MTEETQNEETKNEETKNEETQEQATERDEIPTCEACFWRRVTDGRCHNPQSIIFDQSAHGEACSLYEPA